jgi:hypothetical protein
MKLNKNQKQEKVESSHRVGAREAKDGAGHRRHQSPWTTNVIKPKLEGVNMENNATIETPTTTSLVKQDINSSPFVTKPKILDLSKINKIDLKDYDLESTLVNPQDSYPKLMQAIKGIYFVWIEDSASCSVGLLKLIYKLSRTNVNHILILPVTILDRFNNELKWYQPFKLQVWLHYDVNIVGIRDRLAINLEQDLPAIQIVDLNQDVNDNDVLNIGNQVLLKFEAGVDSIDSEIINRGLDVVRMCNEIDVPVWADFKLRGCLLQANNSIEFDLASTEDASIIDSVSSLNVEKLKKIDDLVRTSISEIGRVSYRLMYALHQLSKYSQYYGKKAVFVDQLQVKNFKEYSEKILNEKPNKVYSFLVAARALEKLTPGILSKVEKDKTHSLNQVPFSRFARLSITADKISKIEDEHERDTLIEIVYDTELSEVKMLKKLKEKMGLTQNSNRIEGNKASFNDSEKLPSSSEVVEVMHCDLKITIEEALAKTKILFNEHIIPRLIDADQIRVIDNFKIIKNVLGPYIFIELIPRRKIVSTHLVNRPQVSKPEADPIADSDFDDEGWGSAQDQVDDDSSQYSRQANPIDKLFDDPSKDEDDELGNQYTEMSEVM